MHCSPTKAEAPWRVEANGKENLYIGKGVIMRFVLDTQESGSSKLNPIMIFHDRSVPLQGEPGVFFANSIDMCEEMDVSKELMKNLLLAAGGSGGTSPGGGGAYGELTNWDRTKKKNGWGGV